MSEQYIRRVGTVRPSHLMFTSGVGSLVDMPNFSVLVRGLDDWQHRADTDVITEQRLLAAVRRLAGHAKVERLRPAPWMEGAERNPTGDAARTGVPVAPFPAWLRCTACNELHPVSSQAFEFDNSTPRRPQDARFCHPSCGKSRRKPLAVAARFTLACTDGHLDEFPYREFVHHWQPCPKGKTHPQLRMDDRGGNIGANVAIKCLHCNQERNISDAQGRAGREKLPHCRGRHPHLGSWFEPKGCGLPARLLVVGASNQWFAQTLSALHVPQGGANELDDKIREYWASLHGISGPAMLPFMREVVPALKEFEKWSDEAVWAAIERYLAQSDEEQQNGYPDLRTPEWEAFTADPLPRSTADFTLRRDPDGVPEPLRGVYGDVVQAERLREVRALVGFTRLDAPDPLDPEMVTPAPLSRDAPTWVPASEVRGEGLFVRVPEQLLGSWERRVADSEALRLHREAYGRFRDNRYSDRVPDIDRMAHWPGARYIALHTLSHLLIRTIALECGYNAASLSERIYSTTEGGDPRSGILIYTAVPDAEGTLGGLVSMAEPANLVRLTRRALAGARHCSSDPLCAERLPHGQEDFLHGAACHVCLFVSETTCERGNRFLDRRFVVPLPGTPDLALYPELP